VAGEWTEISAKYKAPKTAVNITLSITTDSTVDFIFDDVTITVKEWLRQTQYMQQTLC